VLLAVGEINDQGGVLGRPLETVIADGQSEEAVFAHEAARLIEQEKVRSLVGCWTSSSRKAVKAVVEKHDHLLLYPVSYEGMEQSANVVYDGSVPNQQILPALRWSFGFLNKKCWFLVGTDSIFPHAAHGVVSDEARSLGVEIVGEEFLPPRVHRSRRGGGPDRQGPARPHHQHDLRRHQRGVLPCATPRGGGSAARPHSVVHHLGRGVERLAPGEVVGHYAAANYFQSIDLPQNQRFLRLVQFRCPVFPPADQGFGFQKQQYKLNFFPVNFAFSAFENAYSPFAAPMIVRYLAMSRSPSLLLVLWRLIMLSLT
jgi:urea transport system substrate-binding protein